MAHVLEDGLKVQKPSILAPNNQPSLSVLSCRSHFLLPPMSTFPEIIGLFARFASQIEIGNRETSDSDQPEDVLVAALNQSLNLRESSRVRVLDTALSLMCFTAPQVSIV